MDRTQLKSNAREQIRGKIGTLFVIFLIIGALSFLVGLIPILGAIVSLFILSPAFSVGMAMIYLNIVDGHDINVSDIFEGFSYFWGAFKVNFLVGLFTFLWSLLFIVPGIIKSYSYSMAMYIWAENPKMTALDAISASKQIMEGHKMDLFVLQLSFIGWILLGCVTCYLGFIYVVPYMNTAVVNFYQSIKPQPIYSNVYNTDVYNQ